MKDNFDRVESVTKTLKQLIIFVVLIFLFFDLRPLLPVLVERIESALTTGELESMKIGSAFELKFRALSDKVNSPDKLAGKADTTVTSNTKQEAEKLDALTILKVEATKASTASTKQQSYWVYLGTWRGNKWQETNFKISDIPKEGSIIQAVTDVYKRSDEAKLVNNQWIMGKIQGVLRESERVKVKNTVKVTEEEGLQYYWAEVVSP